MDASKGLIEAAEAAANPMSLAFALYADGFAFREVDPARALDAVRRGLVIAQDSGNRLSETQLRHCGPPRSRAQRHCIRVRSPHSGDPQHARRR